ncbi:redoxin domain-containing protein [Autumnicola edwardsiae]|uniref:Redoxin domain-containing protein n=1 Tax=Autumnicola edwardsiae TaxID=3075594 RepID=A0ABU3CSR0_9FLAO|nr:redoxin domain-containing protein [Zunongwangia sp. F297]MDT0649401.1 redoxin domain-containing protein [Zunongwangia sp. F297]
MKRNYLSYLLLKYSLVVLVGAVFAQCKSDTKNSSVSTDENEQAQVVDTFAFSSNPVKVPEQEVKTLEIGDKAPDFNLPGTDGKYHSLSDYSSAKVLAVIFTCNHCPTAQAYEERIKSITSDYKEKSVQVVAISPNSPLGLLPEELGYSDLGDTYKDMIIRDKDKNFNFPYLYDGDNQEVSLAYGPAATPHTFVFDEQRTLQYVGRIDDTEKPGTKNGEDLRNALDKILANEELEEPVTKTFGCSTKWGWKTKNREKIDAEWAEKEVTLQESSTDELKEVIKNNSENLRLINVWATWCAPCRIEYPEFVTIQRMFGDRDFEFVSISGDKLSKKESALDFLESTNSAVGNHIAVNDDKYALIEAIDPEWNGALPYTMLIEPGGNVVWTYQGEVDFLELKKTIVEHPMMGRIY